MIASETFGSERKFKLKNSSKDIRRTIVLSHASLMIKCGETQHNYKQALPTTKRNQESTLSSETEFHKKRVPVSTLILMVDLIYLFAKSFLNISFHFFSTFLNVRFQFCFFIFDRRF